MSDPNHPSPDDIGLPSLQDLVEIGRGGFATVYRAFQPRFNRSVAVKLLDSQGGALANERFERECGAMGALSSHPNIVTVFDAGLTDLGKPYLVMEFMPDGTLEDRLDREGPFPWQEVADLGIKLASALQMAHDAGVLHRDVKPANVLRSPFGEPCLSDFGLARFAGQAKTDGVVSATLLHAAPEILDGQPATPRSDLYSLASSLYTLLADETPFWRADDESMLPLLARILHDPVPDLRARGVPNPVAVAIERAMSKDPGERPASAVQFAEDLREAQRRAGVEATLLRVSGSVGEDTARQALKVTDPRGTVFRGPVTPDSGSGPRLPPPPGLGTAPERVQPACQAVGPPVLEVRQPERRPLLVVVEGALDLGRACDGLWLADLDVSRRHVEVTRDGDELTISDQGSSNGTTLDGLPLTGVGRLRPGSVAKIGHTELRLAPRSEVEGVPVLEVRQRSRRALLAAVPEVLELGRACDGLLLADPDVSRRHVEVTRDGDELTISDQGSSNGTTLDGLPLTGVGRLRPGSVAKIGHTELRLAPAPSSG